MTSIGAYFAELGVSPEALHARGLMRYDEAAALEVAEIGDDGREHRLAPDSARAWQSLKPAAAREGESLARLSYPRGNASGHQYEPWHWCHVGAT